MKLIKSFALAALALAFTTSGVFADDAKEKKPGKKAPDPAARFAKLDKNSDSFVDADELKAGMKKKPEMAEKIMKAKDKDGDNKLSKEEFTAAPKKKKKKDGDKKKKDGDKKEEK